MIEKVKKISLFIGLFLLFLFSDLFYLVPLSLFNINYDTLSYTTQTLLSMLANLILIIIISLIYKKYLKEKIKDYLKKENFKKYFDIGSKWWFLGLIGMCVFNVLIATFSPVKEANNEVLVQEMLKISPILSFISATFLAPFLEEMLFRKSLGDIFKNKNLMVFMSGLVFGLLHVVFSLETVWDLLYAIPYGLLGASFAMSLKETDNVLVPITFHMIHNGILTLVSILPVVLK